MGYALPPGTVIAMQSWSMHCDPAVFPSPDSFIPERWLQGPDTTEKMAQYLMPFGMGSHQCGGMNLAYMMLRITVAASVQNFNVAAPPETNERSMEIKDAFVRVHACFTGSTKKTLPLGHLPCRHGVQTLLSLTHLISVHASLILHLHPP